MAAVTNLAGVALIQESNRDIAGRDVGFVAVHTSGRIGILSLPLGQEHMEVIVEILLGRHVGMALQAMDIVDRLGQGRWLSVMFADKSQQIPGA